MCSTAATASRCKSFPRSWATTTTTAPSTPPTTPSGGIRWDKWELGWPPMVTRAARSTPATTTSGNRISAKRSAADRPAPRPSKLPCPSRHRSCWSRSGWPCFGFERPLHDQLVMHPRFAFRSDESLIQPEIWVRELVGVQAEQVQNRGLQVADCHFVRRHEVTEIVRLAVHRAGLHAATGEQHRERQRVVVAAQVRRAVAGLHHRRATELTAP